MSITTGLAFVAVAARLREDLHFSSVAFTPLHALQLTGSLSGIAAALCGALLLGRGHAYAQKTLTVCPIPCTLRRWSSGLDCSQPALSFLRQTLARVSHWLARKRPGRSRSWAFILADSGSANLWPCVSEKILQPTILAWECWPPSPTFTSRGKQRRG